MVIFFCYKKNYILVYCILYLIVTNKYFFTRKGNYSTQIFLIFLSNMQKTWHIEKQNLIWLVVFTVKNNNAFVRIKCWLSVRAECKSRPQCISVIIAVVPHWTAIIVQFSIVEQHVMLLDKGKKTYKVLVSV